jgi:hypothetical protein
LGMLVNWHQVLPDKAKRIVGGKNFTTTLI